MTLPVPALAAVDELFLDEPVWQVPPLADRYFYKKHSGSSDTSHQKDEFE